MNELPIYSYTRAEALADGALIDVTPMAREAGIRLPTALTVELMADVVTIPPAYAHEDREGRLWDVVWMARCAMMRAPADASELRYQLILHVGDSSQYTVKAVCGPGDDGAPVLTLMRPDED